MQLWNLLVDEILNWWWFWSIVATLVGLVIYPAWGLLKSMEKEDARIAKIVDELLNEEFPGHEHSK